MKNKTDWNINFYKDLYMDSFFPDKEEFYIRRVGEGYVIFPVDDPWFPFRMTIGTFPDDFMEDRDLEQPSILDAPKREDL